MIDIERNWDISAINTNIFSIRSYHMEITTKRHIPFCRWNVFPFYDLQPGTISDAILSIKIHISHNCIDGLIAIYVAIPQ